MRQSNRLFVALHVLVFLAKIPQLSATSARLALSVGTHPVVIRRTLAGLRRAGLVASTGGPGGGWTLGRDASAISLRDIYVALGESLQIAIAAPQPTTECQVSTVVAGVLTEVLKEADLLLMASMTSTSLAEIAARVQRFGKHTGHCDTSMLEDSVPGLNARLRAAPRRRRLPIQ